MDTLHTIGHSIDSLEEFVALLQDLTLFNSPPCARFPNRVAPIAPLGRPAPEEAAAISLVGTGERES